MREDFARLDELMAKDDESLTDAETEELERLVHLLVDPAYQEYRWALIEASTAPKH